MRLRNTLLIGSVIFFSSASSLYAQSASNSGIPTDMNGATFKHSMQIDRQEYKAQTQQNRTDFKQQIQNVRQEMLTKSQAARDAFKTKIAALKDERKKTRVENVTTRFATINTNQTNYMSQALERLTAILDKLSTKSAAAKAAGKDTTALETAITNARTAIATAKTAVTAQAGKQYIPQITTDTTLRQNVSSTFTQLQTDLQTTRKSVQSAKEAVLNAYQELAKINGTTK